jgi:hypothetical protein
MSFYGFSKVSKFRLKSVGLTYDFIENCQFLGKTDRNSVIPYRDPHIMDQLYIMFPYMSSYKF